MYNLSVLKLIASGGQADIYELDNDRILRVLRNPEDKTFALTEFEVMKTLKKMGKEVPVVYDFVNVEGKAAIVMERIYGETMLIQMKKKIYKLFAQVKKLASLQIESAGSAKGLNLISIKQRATHLISKAEMLDSEMKKFVIDIIEELPEGEDICHGDFHPGNIIISEDKYYIIDWFGVTAGRKLSDIAHTFILLKNTPKIENISKMEHFITKTIGNRIAGSYISNCNKIEPFEWSEFSKWMVVRAAERVFYGMPSEKANLIRFIRKSMEADKSKISSELWWKML